MHYFWNRVSTRYSGCGMQKDSSTKYLLHCINIVVNGTNSKGTMYPGARYYLQVTGIKYACALTHGTILKDLQKGELNTIFKTCCRKENVPMIKIWSRNCHAKQIYFLFESLCTTIHPQCSYYSVSNIYSANPHGNSDHVLPHGVGRPCFGITTG